VRDPGDPREWLRHARSNLVLASTEPTRAEILFEHLCFDAQQAAEKALKALLVLRQVDFPKTHSIAELITLVEAQGISMSEELRSVARLSRYAVGTRYPNWGEDVIAAADE
jgi:HEPN domain-containing protein